jgi:hypothetical protein
MDHEAKEQVRFACGLLEQFAKNDDGLESTALAVHFMIETTVQSAGQRHLQEGMP